MNLLFLHTRAHARAPSDCAISKLTWKAKTKLPELLMGYVLGMDFFSPDAPTTLDHYVLHLLSP